MRRLSSFVASLVVLVVLPLFAQTNVVLTTATTPVCTADQNEEWTHIRSHSLGVAGRDPVGGKIGASPAHRSGVGQNWYPLDGFKHTLCGTLHRFNFYDGWGDEADWNNFIMPSPQFAFLLEDARAIASPGDIHDCAGDGDCMEAEVTPDEHFYDNPWFDKSTGSSPLEGNGLCTYGAWVREEAHGDRPEIHPSELLWWRERVDVGPFFLMLVQDDSNRFDRNENYTVSSSPPSWWRPWSKVPLTGEFRIAFQASLAENAPVYRISEPVPSRNVVLAGDFAQDADDGAEHAIVYNGRIAVVAREEHDARTGVKFTDVCRNPANTRLQGYLAVTTQVGAGDRGSEGYHVIRVDRQTGDASVPRRRVTVTLVRVTREVGMGPFAIRLTANGEQRRFPTTGTISLGEGASANLAGAYTTTLDPLATLTARIQALNASGNATASGTFSLKNDAALASGERTVTVRQTLSVGPDRDITQLFSVTVRIDVEDATIPVRPRPGTLAVRALADRATLRRVTTGGQPRLMIDVTTEGDTRGARAMQPTIALAPTVTAGRPRDARRDTSAWSGVARATGGVLRVLPEGAELQAVSQWSLDVKPAYAPLRDGKVSREDDSAASEELNATLRAGTAARRNELFGAAQPFSVNWSFEARNLSTGAVVPVRVGQAPGAGEVRVDLSGEGLPDERVTATFPNVPGAVYELVATARMTDTFGLTSTVEHRLWSHAITGASADALVGALLPSLAPNADAGRRLVEASTLDLAPDDRAVRDPQRRRARMLRLLAMQAADDNVVTIGELQQLTAGARAFQ